MIPFLKQLAHQMKKKNSKELKALFFSAISGLILIILFELYIQKIKEDFLTNNIDSGSLIKYYK